MPEETPPYLNHEHEWTVVLILDGKHSSTGDRPAIQRYRCKACGMEIRRTEGPGIRNVEFAGHVSVYLHTCSACGREYRDANPFSEISSAHDGAAGKFCSLACYAETQERWRKEDLAKLIPSLEAMVADATNDVARVLADERLRVIATDEDEPLRSQARDALKRGRQTRKGTEERRPASVK